jgi:hypothetical protein
MNENIILEIGMMILAAAATYGAIRQDIKNIHDKLSRNEREIDKAHERIDVILTGRKAQ